MVVTVAMGDGVLARHLKTATVYLVVKTTTGKNEIDSFKRGHVKTFPQL